MTMRIENATVEHAHAIAPNLRIFGCGDKGSRPEDVERYVRESVEAWSWFEDDTPIAIAGVLPRNLLANIGIVWLATTPQALRNRRAFWLASRSVASYLRHQYARVEGQVDAEFTASQRWLKRLGFEVIDSIYVFNGQAFKPFVMEQ